MSLQKNGKAVTHDYVVTYTYEAYETVTAVNEDDARAKALRRATDRHPARNAQIIEIERL